MAEQDFSYEEQPGNVLGGSGTNEELIRRRSGQGGTPARLPEKALDLVSQRGSGPASITGRRYERETDTAGKVNALQHSVAARQQATSGQAKRNDLMTARQLKQDPYRDSIRYKEDYGTTFTDAGYDKAEGQRAGFETHVKDTNAAIATERGGIATDTAAVATQFATANATLNSQKTTALGSLPSAEKYKTVSGAYNDWNRTWTTIQVWSKTSYAAGRPEATLRIPRELKSQFISQAGQSGTGWEASGSIVYVGDRGRELYNFYNDTINRANTSFYNTAGPEISNYNRDVTTFNNSITTAKSTINSQFVTAVNDLNGQLSTANSNLSRRRGTVAGAEEGIALEITSRNEYLQEVRDSYTDRLARIDEALSIGTRKRVSSRPGSQLAA
jgi:hypothetical protein